MLERGWIRLSIQIRMIEEQDIPNVLEIYRPYVENSVITFEYEVPSLSSFQERVHHKLEQFPWLVIEMDGELCGYAYASIFRERIAYQWDCELSVYIAQDKSGHHLGSMLYEALIQLVQVQGYIQAYGLVTLPNDASLALHRKFAFQEEGILSHTGYKQGRWLDVMILRKQINAFDSVKQAPISIQAVPKDICTKIFKEVKERSEQL